MQCILCIYMQFVYTVYMVRFKKELDDAETENVYNDTNIDSAYERQS